MGAADISPGLSSLNLCTAPATTLTSRYYGSAAKFELDFINSSCKRYDSLKILARALRWFEKNTNIFLRLLFVVKIKFKIQIIGYIITKNYLEKVYYESKGNELIKTYQSRYCDIDRDKKGSEKIWELEIYDHFYSGVPKEERAKTTQIIYNIMKADCLKNDKTWWYWEQIE